MSERDDQLIAEFNVRRSEEAFAALVRQHVNLVFATALRQVGDAGAAEEITQNVFVALAQAAGKLGSHPTIAGWLHQTALNKSREWLRSELRRRRREQVAVNLDLARAEGDSVWTPLVPLLDEALLKLREPDRQAVILHFMEGQTFQEVGSALGVGEDAARKRVQRCLDQLTQFFRRRGFAVPALVAGAPIFTLSSHAAPAGLAASATTAGLAAAHSAASASTLTLIKGALKIMAWTKAKTTIVAGVIVLLAAGTTTVTIKEIQDHRTYPWQVHPGNITDDQVNQPPQVRILASKFKESNWPILRGKMIGFGVRAQNVVASAYGHVTSARVVFSTELPAGRYDYIACLPDGIEANATALQQEAKRKFGVVGRVENRNTDAWLLKVKSPDLPGLKRSDRAPGNGLFTTSSGFRGWHEAMSNLAYALEDKAGVPVFDQTGLTDFFGFGLRFDFDLNCTESDLKNHDWNAVNLALGKLGLELVPTNMPIKVLVVEKAK